MSRFCTGCFRRCRNRGWKPSIYFIRKCAHLTEYAMLALLLWRAVRKPVKNDPRPWIWREARLALLLVVLYAASDEFHQLFVPSRDAAVHRCAH